MYKELVISNREESDRRIEYYNYCMDVALARISELVNECMFDGLNKSLTLTLIKHEIDELDRKMSQH